MLTPTPGTFARVWLVRFTDPAPEDRDKVFALKILRKVDGMRSPPGLHLQLLMAMYQSSVSSRWNMCGTNATCSPPWRGIHL